MRILYISTRDLLCSDSQRVAGIVIRLNLLAKKHELHVVWCEDEPRSDIQIRKVIPQISSHLCIRAPAGPRLLGRIAFALRNGLPLQVAACFDRDNVQAIAAFAAKTKFDVIIYDTIRTLLVRRAMPSQPGQIHILDADDLFSIRYRDLARSNERGAFLGNFTRRVPSALVPLASI